MRKNQTRRKWQAEWIPIGEAQSDKKKSIRGGKGISVRDGCTEEENGEMLVFSHDTAFYYNLAQSHRNIF